MPVNGFFQCDIAAVSVKFAAVQSRRNSHRVDQVAAGGVQQNRSRAHLGDPVTVDEVLGLRGGRAVKGQHIRTLEDLVEFHLFTGEFGVKASGVTDDLHAETRCGTRGGTAGLPATDNAERQPIEFDQRCIPKTEIRTVRPAPACDIA